jgi:hypothetical protein
MGKRVAGRTMVLGLVLAGSLGAARSARAELVFFEAESVRSRVRGTITSPMLIKDDPTASGGSYITVATPNESPSNAPASTVEGVAKYTFSVGATGTYRIWARVSAPSNGDDSFWVRMGDSGPWIRWNGMALGTAYHWVLVAADPPASPATFNLVADGTYELQIAYREDGARLDALYITNDTGFNPTAALTAPPLPPKMHDGVSGGGSAKVSWSAVPGAVSYTLERRSSGCSFNEQTQCCEPDEPYQVIATGLTGHKYTTTTSGEFRVTAVAPTGSSFHPVPQGPDNCRPYDPSTGSADAQAFHWRAQVPVLSVTPPMAFNEGGSVLAPAGMESLNAVPAHGRARMDFELAAPATMRMWAEIVAPNADQDSFWVRWDDGVWIKWNNLNDFCHTLHDSSKAGEPIVKTPLLAGSHRIEWAWREGGAELYDNIILLEDSPAQGEQCSD